MPRSNKGAQTQQLPTLSALKVLDKGEHTLLDYAKLAPNDLKQANSVPSSVLSLIAKSRQR